MARVAELQARDVDEVAVVGKEKDLGTVGKLREDPEPRRGPLVIKIDEKIIRHERQRRSRRGVFLDRGDPEREEQLVGRSGAEPGNRHGLAPGTDAHRRRSIPIVVVDA